MDSRSYQPLYSQLQRLDKSFRDIDSSQRKYSKISKRYITEEQMAELDEKASKQLYELYNDFFLSLSKSEEIIQTTLENLDDLIESRCGPPKKSKKIDERPPKKKKKLSHTKEKTIDIDMDIDDEPTIPIGHKVAAFVRNTDWILADVADYDSSTQIYHIKDADEEEIIFYDLPEKFIIPTQTGVKRSTRFQCSYEFIKGQNVLALFPQTTCFYKATVLSITRRNKRISDYQLHFDDDEDENGNVPKRKVSARYVVPYPE